MHFLWRNFISLSGRGASYLSQNVVVGSSKYLHISSNFQSSKRELFCVKREEKKVKPFGYVELSNVDLDLSIQPADPNQYPDSDTAIFSFYTEKKESAGDATKSSIPEFIKAEDKLSLALKESYSPNGNKCLLEVPMKYDIDAANLLGENSVEIRSMESGSIRVTTGSGNISSKSIKGDFISLLSQSGNITCSSVSQGRIILQTGSGDIHGHKFQGPKLKISTNSGAISADSVYSDESWFASANGNITLKNLHRKSTVKITGNGNLIISGMDGSLDAHLGIGRHHIQISQLSDGSSIRVVQGSLTLQVPDPCPFGIRIRAQTITLPDTMANSAASNFQTHQHQLFEYNLKDENVTNPAAKLIEIEAEKGQVTVEYSSWISSLGLRWNQ